MTEKEKKECDDILRYGKIIKDEEYEKNGDFKRYYTIEKDGVLYRLGKTNGEWTLLAIWG